MTLSRGLPRGLGADISPDVVGLLEVLLEDVHDLLVGATAASARGGGGGAFE